MEEIGEMLRTMELDSSKPPASAADLGRVDPLLPLSAEALRTGEIVYIWGAGLSPTGAGKVLAYEKKAETERGWVLMQDGKVLEMTMEEFKSAGRARR